MNIDQDYIDFMNAKAGAYTMQQIFEGGVACERARCLTLILAVRAGEIYGSDRAVVNFIKSGQPVSEIVGEPME